jgi:hypothetical protein
MLRRPYAIALLVTSISFAMLQARYPFPTPMDNPLLLLIVGTKPMVYAALKMSWASVLLLLPAYMWFGVAAKMSRTRKTKAAVSAGMLPPYPAPGTRLELFTIVGELHHPDSMEPSITPRWCEIPEAGLSRGVMILGSIGTGKTSSCLLPIADQVLGYEAHDRSRRCGGLVLEVKMDFCRQIQQILTRHGRGGDYMEIGAKSPYCYNPLYNDASSTTLAYRLISVLSIIQGRVGSKDAKFWDEAAQGFITFLILIHRLLYEYVTFRDLYIASSSQKIVDQMMENAEGALNRACILVSKDDYLKMTAKAARQLDLFEPDASGEHLRLEVSDKLVALLEQHSIPFERVDSGASPQRRAAFESAKLYYEKLKALSPELRTNIAETVNVALQPFDMDSEARRIFCPPKAAYDPVLNRDARHGMPLPSFDKLIESPAVLALALPAATDEKVARIAGVMLKQDWQRAVLMRKGTPGWEMHRSRKLLLLIDEYHLLATAGGAEPDGDEKFLNLCRDVGCLPVVATQSLSSLRATVGNNEPVITQALQTTICLRQKDSATAEWMSRMVGRKDVLREHWGVSEGQSGVVPSLTGGLVAPSGSMNMSRGWNEQRDSIFEPKFMHELPDGVAVACVYNGFLQLPPTLLYLHPHGGDKRISWFKTNESKRKPASAKATAGKGATA